MGDANRIVLPAAVAAPFETSDVGEWAANRKEVPGADCFAAT
jgi:hypothetical protein